MNTLYVEALQQAVDDYNNWATKNGRDYNIIKSYNELRGIFYNKMVSLLSSYMGLRRGSKGGFWYRTNFSMLHALPVDKLSCRFSEGSYLEAVSIEEVRGWDTTAIDRIKEALKEVNFNRDPYMRIIQSSYRKIANL